MLHDFILHKNFFNSFECSLLLEHFNKNRSKDFQDFPGEGKNLNCFVADIDEKNVLLNKFFSYIEEVNEDFFGFDLYMKKPRGINVNQYLPGHEYKFHLDRTFFGSLSDVKLTAVCNISTKKYIGGNFELFMGESREIEFNPGSLIVFPSFFYHRVKPVIDGERYTFSAWFTGKNWK